MHMGKTIQRLREEKNWPVTRLEEYSGVDRQTIYRLERTGRGHIETYEKLLGAMGYELEVVKKDGWNLCG